MSDWYLDFVDLNYKPDNNDLICLFRAEPARGFSMKEVAGRVASESSVGTWTKLYRLPRRIKSLMARVFEIKGNWIKVAYPPELFEPGNMPQIFSSIAGNIFGMKALNNLRLEDVEWPKKIMKSFEGPQFGIRGLRKKFKVHNRPLLATVPKPKLGMATAEYIKVAGQIWKGGMDFVKNDENMTSQNFVEFYETTRKIFELRDKVERQTGEKKMYLPNVSAETKEMIKRAEFVAENDGEIVMVDALTTGWAGLQTLRNVCQELKLAIYMHRAFHSTFTRNPRHGVSMLVVADASRLIGVDTIHIGGMGKLVSPAEEVYILKEEVEKRFIREHGHVLQENWYNIKPVFPVTSGGLHPGILPRLIKLLGKELILQVGGGVLGHPSGPLAGGRAVRQAVEATLHGIALKKYAKNHPELKQALELWGTKTPI